MADVFCQNCRKSYCTDRGRPRLPLVLSCGHTFCDTCVGQWMQHKKKKEFVVCTACRKQNLFSSQRAVEAFPVDVYILGLIALQGISANAGAGAQACSRLIREFDHSSTFSKVTPPSSPGTPQREHGDFLPLPLCSECQDELAFGACPCGKFCRRCFPRLHSGSKALATHTLQPLLSSDCALHPYSPVEWWCTQCMVPICSECLTIEHRGHSVIGIQDARGDLESMVRHHNTKLVAGKTVMAKADQTVDHLLSLLKNDCKRVTDEIHAHACDLHSQLQHQFDILLSTVGSHGFEQLKQLRQIKEEIRKQMETRTKAERWFSRSSRPNSSVEVLLQTDKALKQAHAMDPVAIAVDEQAAPLQFIPGSLSQPEIGSISGLCTRGMMSHVALPEGALPKHQPGRSRFFTPPLKTGALPTAAVPISSAAGPPVGRVTAAPLALQMPDRKASPSAASVQLSAAGTDGQRSQTPRLHHRRFDDWTEVKVVSVRTAAQFLLQKTSDIATIDQLSERLAADVGKRRLEPLIKLRKGELVAAQFEDSRWYRARINRLASEAGPNVHPPPNTHAFIEYIDFGNWEWVSFTSLKVLPLSYQEFPPFALKCCLDRVAAQPNKNDAEFVRKVHDEVTGLLQEKITRFKVYSRFENGVFYGDIKLPNSNASLREFLGEQDYAMVKPIPEPDVSEVGLDDAASVDVTVSNCVSPCEFYVQQADEWGDMLANMVDEIQEAYVGQNVPCPESIRQGELYCAEYAADHVWYRVVVTELEFSGAVVRYVDYGNSEHVGWSKLRVLQKSFVHQPALATRCFAVDIRPVKSTTIWSAKACEKWLELCQEKDFVLLRKGDAVDGKGYPVELVDTSQADVDIYPSQQLIEMSLAIAARDAKPVQNLPQKAVPPVPLAKTSQATAPGTAALQQQPQQLLTPAQLEMEASGPSVSKPSAKPTPSPAAAAATPAAGGGGGAPPAAAPPLPPTAVQALTTTRTAMSSPSGFAHLPAAAGGSGATTLLPRTPPPPLQGAKRTVGVVSASTSRTAIAERQQETLASAVQPARASSSTSSARQPSPGNNATPIVIDLQALRQRHEKKLQARLLEEQLHEKSHIPLPLSQWATAYTPSWLERGVDHLQTTSVIGCYLYSPNHFYVQLKTKELDDLEQLAERLEEYAEKTAATCPGGNWAAGHLCAARYEDEKAESVAWCRGIVVDVQDTTAKVYFVDFGNIEAVSASSLLPLPTALSALPAQAVKCSLCRVSPSSDGELRQRACDIMEEEFGETPYLDVLVLGEPSLGVLPVDLLVRPEESGTPSHSLSDVLLMSGVVEASSGPPTTLPSHPYYAFVCPSEMEFWMRVVHIDKLGRLYGNRILEGQEMTALHQMEKRMHSELTTSERSKDVLPVQCWPGQVGCVFSSSKHTFQRCQVRRILPDLEIEVLLVDRGTTEVMHLLDFIAKPFERSLPVQAIVCSIELPTSAGYGEISEELVQRLEAVVLHKQCLVRQHQSRSVPHVSGSPLRVQIFLPDGTEVQEQLVAGKDPIAMLLSSVSTSTTDGSEPMSAALVAGRRLRRTNPRSVSTPPPLHQLVDVAEEFENSPISRPPCLVDDHMLNADGNLPTNSDMISNSYAPIPLPGIGGKMAVQLSEITLPNEFHLQILSSADRSREQCMLQQFSIARTCRELASHADSLAAFSPPPSAGAPCLASFGNDGRLYRAEVLSCVDGRADIRFVDYGNMSYGEDSSRLRKVPPELCAIPPQAMHVVLADIEAPSAVASNTAQIAGTAWSQAALEWLRMNLQQQELLATIVDASKPLSVTLELKGTSVSEHLVAAGYALWKETANGSGAGDGTPAVSNSRSSSTRSSNLSPIPAGIGSDVGVAPVRVEDVLPTVTTPTQDGDMLPPSAGRDATANIPLMRPGDFLLDEGLMLSSTPVNAVVAALPELDFSASDQSLSATVGKPVPLLASLELDVDGKDSDYGDSEDDVIQIIEERDITPGDDTAESEFCQSEGIVPCSSPIALHDSSGYSQSSTAVLASRPHQTEQLGAPLCDDSSLRSVLSGNCESVPEADTEAPASVGSGSSGAVSPTPNSSSTTATTMHYTLPGSAGRTLSHAATAAGSSAAALPGFLPPNQYPIHGLSQPPVSLGSDALTEQRASGSSTPSELD